MRVNRYESFERTFLLRTDIRRTVSLPSLPICAGRTKYLYRRVLRRCLFSFLPKELLPEEHKEVVDEDPHKHRRLYRIEPLHREAAQGKVFFQFLDGVLIVCPGLAQGPYVIGRLIRIGDPGAIAVVSDLNLVGKEGQCFPHRLVSLDDILPHHDVPSLLSPEGMHEGELRYGKPFGYLLPVGEGVDLPLDGSYESHRNDVGEVFLLKRFDELLEIEPAVGDDAQNLDAGPDTLIGSGKEGKDVVP